MNLHCLHNSSHAGRLVRQCHVSSAHLSEMEWGNIIHPLTMHHNATHDNAVPIHISKYVYKINSSHTKGIYLYCKCSKCLWYKLFVEQGPGGMQEPKYIEKKIKQMLFFYGKWSHWFNTSQITVALLLSMKSDRSSISDTTHQIQYHSYSRTG